MPSACLALTVSGVSPSKTSWPPRGRTSLSEPVNRSKMSELAEPHIRKLEFLVHRSFSEAIRNGVVEYRKRRTQQHLHFRTTPGSQSSDLALTRHREAEFEACRLPSLHIPCQAILVRDSEPQTICFVEPSAQRLLRPCESMGRSEAEGRGRLNKFMGVSPCNSIRWLNRIRESRSKLLVLNMVLSRCYAVDRPR